MKGKAASPRPAVPGRLFRKYLLVMVSLVGGALIASGLLQLYFSYQANRQALLDAQARVAGATATAVENHLGGITAQVTDELLTIAPCGGTTAQECLQPRSQDFWVGRYRQMMNDLPEVTDIWQVDTSGRQLIHLSRAVPGFLVDPKTDQPLDWSRQTVFTELGNGPNYGAVLFSTPGSPSIRIGFSHFLTSFSPTMAGLNPATIIEVHLTFLNQAIQLPLPRGGDTSLVDSSGRVLAATDPQLAPGESLGRWRQVMAAQTAPSSALQPGSVASTGPEGVPMLAAYAPIGPLGWLAIVEQPQAQVYAPLYGLLGRLAILLVVALLIAIIASFLLARRMVQPVDALRRGAASVAAGDLSKPIDVHTGDELQALAEEFNRMTARLRASYEGLEEKVRERTRELDATMVELEEKSRQLEIASRHKSEFLASMSHELRTPLNAMIGFSEVLLARMYGDLNEKQADYLQDVHSSGEHLLSLINDILDLSKVEAGRMEVQRSVFPLPEVLTHSLSTVRERAIRQDISLEAKIDPALGLFDADERKVKQILFNLLSNAVKFTPAGGRITLSAHPLRDSVEISVSDTGVGIGPENHERIFEEFQQLGGPAQEGTGLGLALTRRFVELQGGQIRVRSAPGQGTTFTFTLPTHTVPVGQPAEVAS